MKHGEEVRAFTFTGRVEAVLVTADPSKRFETAPTGKLCCVCGEGVRGTGHWGAFRGVGAREADMRAFGFERGWRIFNQRMFSAVSAEELRTIAGTLQIPAVPYGCLGENLIISGVPDFSQLPSNTRLFFTAPSGEPREAVLEVHEENKPCIHPGELLQTKFPDVPGIAKLFAKAAYGLRGVVGTVYSTGYVTAGDTITVKVPKQRVYVPQG